MRHIATFLCAAIAVAVGPLLMLAQAPAARAGDPILVVMPGAEAAVLRAGGTLIGPVSAPLAALATGDTEFLARIRMSEAWFVTDGQWIAEICGADR